MIKIDRILIDGTSFHPKRASFCVWSVAQMTLLEQCWPWSSLTFYFLSFQSKSEIQKVGHAAYKAQIAEERKSKLKSKVMQQLQQPQQNINADDDDDEEDEETKKLRQAGR